MHRQFPYDRVLVVADWRADAHAVTAAVESRSAEHVAVFYLPDAPARTQRFLGYSLDGTGARPLLGPGRE